MKKSFLSEKNIIDGDQSLTIHEDELKNGLRRRLRKSGKMEDKSKIIERISLQQQKRNAGYRFEKLLYLLVRYFSRVQSARGARKAQTNQPRIRRHKLGENWKRPLSSKAGLPVQITTKNGQPFLKVDLTYYDGKPEGMKTK